MSRTWWCRIIGHTYMPTSFETWQYTGLNFACTRCRHALRCWPPTHPDNTVLARLNELGAKR